LLLPIIGLHIGLIVVCAGCEC